MAESDEEFHKDKRTTCKYGSSCYQKNPDHRKKYKHPPKGIPKELTKAKETRNDHDDVEMPAKKPRRESIDDIEETDKLGTNSEENETHKEFIKSKFLVNMPGDFYTFWDFCKMLNEKMPSDALKSAGLTLVGPYDVLAGKFANVHKTPEEYLIHWRYYYDPPEFQTILKGDEKTGFHIGYFRDCPDEPPVFLASNQAAKDGSITVMGDNIFAAVNTYLEDLKKTGDPFKKMSIPRIQGALKKRADQLQLDLSIKSSKITERDKQIVTRCFNKAGLVVPYNKKTQLGYRELAVSNKALQKILFSLKTTKDKHQELLSQLQPVITYAEIAMDECDFGTGLELGWNILYFGVDSINATAKRFLVNSYNLLKREAFAKIAEAHLNNRRTGCHLSIL